MTEALMDQARPLLYLNRMLAKNALPHALLFSGIKGIGKEYTSKLLSMAVNCRSKNDFPGFNETEPETLPACGECKSCRKIRSGNHPDILKAGPDGKFIKIGQIRALIRALGQKPVEAQKRVVIIRDAEKMNPEAANALLKVLEEPPPSTMFILITSHPAEILPTIRSRCSNLGFNPVSSEKIAVYIQNTFNQASEFSDTLAALSEGSPKKAVELAESRLWTGRRLWLLNALASIKNGPYLNRLLLAEKIAGKKDQAPEILDILLTCVRDLIIFKFSPEKITNRDLAGQIAEISAGFSLKSLLSTAGHIQKTAGEIRNNVSLRLALEVMALKIIRE